MTEAQHTGPRAYEDLRKAALERIESGRLEEALELFDGALEAARQTGDAELADAAFCNRAAVAITLGDLEEPVPELRRILMANGALKSGFLAAYNIARAYELRKEHKKGLFYAQIARHRATALENEEWLGWAFNQIGNFQVAECFFQEAKATYARALQRLAAASHERRLTVEINLGYCDLMLERLDSGLGRLYGALRAVRRLGLRRLEMIARLDLCYGLLEARRLRMAWKHGSRGLAIAEEIGEPEPIKNGLFLLGEVAVAAGEIERGHGLFGDLQNRFYPDQPYLPDLLVSVDVRPMVNLRA